MMQQDIFTAALQIPDADERAAYLAQAYGGDAELLRRVEILLRAYEGAGDFLARPALEQLAGEPSTRPASLEDVSQREGTAGDAGLDFLQPSCTAGSLGRLDHHEILEVIGRGGMGVVLRARDTKLLRIVALKVLAAPLAVSGTARQRFAREARAAAAVRDEHVIDIHAVCDEAPVPYLVMEYIDGPNLETRLRKCGPLEVKEVLRIGMQVARGLAAAHQQGLIHRDVKPANILLENGVQRVKLTDFGLARAADDASLTQTGFIAGTPLYMAPEQAVGETIDARADLFSLGSVLYELCTGRSAFRAQTTVAVIKRVCEDMPRPIREVNPDIPESVCRVIERLHAKKPTDRPASALEVADLLAGLLADLQHPAPVGNVSNVPANPARRKRAPHRWWFWAAAALVVLCAGLGLGEATGVTDVRGTVIRLFSPEGTLVVEVDDPGVSVAVDGGDVVITGAGAKEIRLKPGQYKIEASKDGKVVRQELVTVVRNGRQVVRISQDAVPLTSAEVWEKSVAALPPEKQVEAVERRLRELNPDFRGKVESSIRDGKVWRLGFLTDRMTDISPVRALKGLEWLDCGGSAPRKGRLSDLTPLRGMRLMRLRCEESHVTDLEPLRDMPLEYLHVQNTGVVSLSPLEGMKLVSLTIQETSVSDLKPIQGMPLKWLDLYGLSGVTDLSPLEGMPLEYLNVTGAAVNDARPLGSLKALRILLLDDTRITDLGALRELQLERISLLRTAVTDLTPLKGMSLKQIRIDYRPEREKFLRSFKGLEFINDKPVAVFWKEVDGK
jgi:tRNA A-37 threonylcarbamoyl transferase component Bud32